MKKIIKSLIKLLASCISLGFIVGIIEKNNGKEGWTRSHTPYGVYEEHVKRPLDFGLSTFALILLWPILLIIAIAVRINMGSPVVFTQERPGLGGKIFRIKKFRTMTDERDVDGDLLPDEQRLTGFGKFLRASSGDELLELANIVKGDMAIVGPRPLLVRYLPAYSNDEEHRHDVRPGLTGLAQVNGRNYVPWDERLAYDVKYVSKITFFEDIKIIVETVLKVVRHDGVATNTEEIDEGYLDEIRGVSR